MKVREPIRTRGVGPRALAAFTLIELILVIFIVGVLAAMALPALGDFKKDRDLKTAAAITQQALNYARSLAVTTGRRTRLVPAPERVGEFTLEVEDNPLTEPGSFSILNWPMGITGTLPESVRVKQIYYPVPEEDETAEPSAGGTQIVTESEALEERQSALLFDPDGSTRDTFIYLYVAGTGENLIEASEVPDSDVLTVAIVGVIGTSVVIPGYTEEIFEIYEPTDLE